ncbi:helix-turn-helix domain-containing protein [Pseudaestuariivita rosea]|uniref:helix-turn-helix domain-containing protein n=1 Tax=Pseudaestuariivita rosea TaxID=2763263 RepID=UPI001ABBCDC5|nr:helix-turn-helix domain-containing protein [Pseudaestuariivita rosea]
MSASWRQEWAQAIRAATELSMTARMLGQVLALDYANGQTGQCNPSRETLARHLGVSEGTIKRAISDLVKAGWLARTEATGRNRTVQYSFLSPGTVVGFNTNKRRDAGQKRPVIRGSTRVKSVLPHIKEGTK